MVRDYSLPARTEFARGLESQLAASVEFLWSMRPPAASQTNALKYFRHHLTQLPNNVDEFDAKKQLQEEIDRYIAEQIDKAGEAISTAVREKISTGDNILTYGCSSLIERIFSEAHEAGVQFRAVVVGTRVQRGAREMLRRLVSRGVVCTYADISALSFLMRDMSKVLIGAASLLANGAVLAPVGSLQAALVARAHNVPLLVACETHKFSDNVQTDAFVYNEIGDPDDIIDKSDDNSPLKDWRSNPNLTLLNLTYDVTPPSLVTAVVTEQAILPCTSAPVVLRFRLS
uniref:Translation initiation factor eIF2B subunit delta n=2 Tax=Pararge aegeria TaxID=116150 RepID=S4NMK9_9NEOP